VLLQDFTGIPALVDLAAMRQGAAAPRRSTSPPASIRRTNPTISHAGILNYVLRSKFGRVS